MIQDIRLYKRFDADLIALHENGYAVGALIKASLLAYASGKGLCLVLSETFSHDIRRDKSFRIRLDIKDKQAAALLRRVKRGYRNAFCKALLRNTLSSQNLGVFFDNEKDVAHETARMNADFPEDGIVLDAVSCRRANALIKGNPKQKPARTAAKKSMAPKKGEKKKQLLCQNAVSRQKKSPQQRLLPFMSRKWRMRPWTTWIS